MAVYPLWTRAQLERHLALEQAGIKGAGNQRLLLWLDGYPIPVSRIAADLKTVATSALEFAARAHRDLEPDRMVFEMLDRHDPSDVVRWARQQLPKRSDLETALLQMIQLAGGTSPSDLMLDAESARPLHLLLRVMVPGIVPSAEELATVMSLDATFAHFMQTAASFPTWSLAEWANARDDQLVFRAGNEWDVLTAGLSGLLLLSVRLALLIACGAMRKVDGQEWEVRIREMRARADSKSDSGAMETLGIAQRRLADVRTDSRANRY